MIPRFFSLERSGPGTLSTMARPGGDGALAGELSAMVELGVGGLVSMLTPDEAAMIGLAHEAEAAADAGLEFLSVPIRDLTVPGDGLEDASAWVRSLLDTGTHVIVHCRAGIGRSSMLAAAVLVDEGLEPDDAWNVITEARGIRVPDTPGQRAWLSDRVAPSQGEA